MKIPYKLLTCEQFEKKVVKHCFKVLCAVLYSQIVGPYFFEESIVTGPNYLEMPRTFSHQHLRKHWNSEEFQQVIKIGSSYIRPHKIILMNFCFVSTLEIDSICVTFDFSKVYFLSELPLFCKSLAFPWFLRYLHVSYMKKIPLSIPTICNKPHVDILNIT